ncbi:hypothetical protein Tco_0459250 [Tanacetum coccineum]
MSRCRNWEPLIDRSREVFQLTQVCGSRDAFPSLVVPLVHFILASCGLYLLSAKTYNLSTLALRDSVQIAGEWTWSKKHPPHKVSNSPLSVRSGCAPSGDSCRGGGECGGGCEEFKEPTTNTGGLGGSKQTTSLGSDGSSNTGGKQHPKGQQPAAAIPKSNSGNQVSIPCVFLSRPGNGEGENGLKEGVFSLEQNDHGPLTIGCDYGRYWLEPASSRYKTDQDILDEVVPSTNRQEHDGRRGRKATTTIGGSSNHQRQQQPPAAAATTGGNLAVNRSQPKSTAVNQSQQRSTTAPKKIIHKLEGVRRRFFWGGNTEVDKVAWIAWDKALLLRTNGDLGIGSLKASNQSLLAKWWWRFHNKDTAIWCKVIRSIHGESGGILSPKSHKNLFSTWSEITKLKDNLSKININLPRLFKKKIGNGQTTSFWHDNWLGCSTLHETLSCLYRLELDPICLVCEKSINVPQPIHTFVHSAHSQPSDVGNNENNTNQIHMPINQNSPLPHNIGPYSPWSWRRAIRSQQEYEEMTTLTNLLIGLHLSTNQDT